MSFEILVVDDHKQAAVEFSRLIEVKAKLSTVATDDPEEALELLRNHPIKVALLDQRMPKKDGTELYRDLKKVDPLLKAIMLTGEADPQEVGDALKLGFSDYIHKSEVENLAPRVLQHYCSYHTDIAEQSNVAQESIFSFSKGLLWEKYRIDFALISAKSLDVEYSPDDLWITIVKIDAGERKKRTVIRQDTERLLIEIEEKAKLSASVNAGISVVDSLTVKIESTLEEMFRGKVFEEKLTADTVEREFKLREEPADPETLHVKSRQYEQAPVYQRIRVLIGKTCSCCGSTDILTVNVNLLTSKIATRQIDYMNDGTKRIIQTGTVLR